MPEKDNTGMGERIQSMVEDAVASMDFEQLNRNITGSIQSVFEELNIQMPQGTGQKGSRASNVRYHYGTEKTGERAVTRYLRIHGTVQDLLTALGGVFKEYLGLPPLCVVFRVLFQVRTCLGAYHIPCYSSDVVAVVMRRGSLLESSTVPKIQADR
ncbi:MAG: hypothetical protein ACLR5Q_12025 [Coprococcus sp.]